MIEPYSSAELEINCKDKLGQLSDGEAVQVVVGPWHEGELATVEHIDTGIYRVTFEPKINEGELPLVVRVDGKYIHGSRKSLV